jgi:CheY-like chemotaxis protein
MGTATQGGSLESVTAADQNVRGIILIVEDDEGVRLVMRAALEDEGWRVETAEHGKAALELLAHTQPDAIILDLRMPVMDGLTFAERYRQFAEPRAPLILISATVSDAAIRQSGAATGLRKPIDLGVLLDTVERFAGGPTAAETHAS